jgi:rare lipoprotein A
VRLAALFAGVALAAGCAAPEVVPTPEPAPGPVAKPAPTNQTPGKGGYYKDDGPGENPPANLGEVADATPRLEPLHRYANRPYQRFGVSYVPLTSVAPFRQAGIASWYGRRFQGQTTSSGEVYDMYKMTAAHPTLPIPSYARVTNAANGRSVVVRINDRGPFHSDRIIDLSYVAAWKLGLIEAGSGRVIVEAIVPGKVALEPVENPAAALSVR